MDEEKLLSSMTYKELLEYIECLSIEIKAAEKEEGKKNERK